MVIFSSNTSYFSLYNYGLGHPTLCVNLSDSSGLDHSLGSRVIAVFSKRRCLNTLEVPSPGNKSLDPSESCRDGDCTSC